MADLPVNIVHQRNMERLATYRTQGLPSVRSVILQGLAWPCRRQSAATTSDMKRSATSGASSGARLKSGMINSSVPAAA